MGWPMTSLDYEILQDVRGRYSAAALTVIAGSGASTCRPSDGPQAWRHLPPKVGVYFRPSDALSTTSDTDGGDIFGAAVKPTTVAANR